MLSLSVQDLSKNKACYRISFLRFRGSDSMPLNPSSKGGSGNTEKLSSRHLVVPTATEGFPHRRRFNPGQVQIFGPRGAQKAR